MNAHLNKAILLLSFLLFSHFFYGQKEADEKLQIAIDSLIVNPNFSYQSLLKIAKNGKNSDSLRAKAKLQLGNYFNSIGIVDSLLFYTKESLTHLNSKKHLAEAYRIMGSGYRRSGKIDDAIEILFKSLEISEKINYKEMISKVKSDLGILYGNKNELDKAIQYFEESIASAYNDQAIYANYLNIGSIYFFKKDLDNAEKYFIKAFELTPPEKDPKVSATLSLNIGSVLFENKKYNEAIEYYEKSRSIADAYGFKDKSINAIAHEALVIDALGNSKKAITMLTEALPKAVEIDELAIQKNIYENLATVYTNADKHKLANTALVEFHKLKDSINNRKQRKEITELEVKYETAEKEKEILVLKEDQLLKDGEISKQRLLKQSFVIGFIIILIPIVALLIVYYQKLKVKNKYNLQKEESHKQKINAILKGQELKLANTYTIAQNEERGRIARELHDSVGGNLAAIKLQLMNPGKDKGKEDDIVDQIDEVYEQVREISHNLTPKGLNNTSFTKFVGDYIHTIEKVTEPDITFVPYPIDKVDQIDEKHKVEIFKIIQELLTNALKHARAKVIEVCLNAYKDTVEIIFEDDGIGFDTQKVADGIGLQNVRDRLSVLRARIDIDSAINRGTAIRIKIPTEDNDKG
ncbi:sensor histidine kinase [Aquimarina sp. MMG016]|uniref:tetratricopeptide repeat-containing sensor histidine kinase n=1 Tax=Aquimarina sp. MMG016 TaxID=2822690 RepID=UPI001B39DFF0|nr:sensor histidine kinase [Aquimarina sp. MMG016]MBQ4822428.1 sensor histidine kinase [Aquimarina sp. MMG016]